MTFVKYITTIQVGKYHSLDSWRCYIFLTLKRQRLGTDVALETGRSIVLYKSYGGTCQNHQLGEFRTEKANQITLKQIVPEEQYCQFCKVYFSKFVTIRAFSSLLISCIQYYVRNSTTTANHCCTFYMYGTIVRKFVIAV